MTTDRTDRKVIPITTRDCRRGSGGSTDASSHGPCSAEFVEDFRGREIWSYWVRQDKELTFATRVTAGSLAAHLNIQTGRLNPSMRRLAECTGQSEQGIVNQIKALVGHGWVVKDGTKGRVSNSYRLRNKHTFNRCLELVTATQNGSSGLNPQSGLADCEPSLNQVIPNPPPTYVQPATAIHPNKENSLNMASDTGVQGVNKFSMIEQTTIRAALREVLGPEAFATWLEPAVFHWTNPVKIEFKLESYAGFARTKFGDAFDEVLGKGRWETMTKTWGRSKGAGLA